MSSQSAMGCEISEKNRTDDDQWMQNHINRQWMQNQLWSQTPPPTPPQDQTWRETVLQASMLRKLMAKHVSKSRSSNRFETATACQARATWSAFMWWGDVPTLRQRPE
jgi:hypothetical protein